MFLTGIENTKYLKEEQGDFNQVFNNVIRFSNFKKTNVEIWHIDFENIKRKITTVIYKKKYT